MLLILFFSAAYKGAAQIFPNQQWRPGMAVLTTGDTIKGKIKYNLQEEVIQIENKDKVATFNAAQLTYFEVKPDRLREERVFYSIPLRNKAGYFQPRFYELMSQGEVSLLGREYIAVVTQAGNTSFIRPMNSSFASIVMSSANTRKFMAYKLFLANSKGDVIPLGETVKSTVNAFGNNKGNLRKFIKEQEMTLLNVFDFVKLVKYYNQLSASSS